MKSGAKCEASTTAEVERLAAEVKVLAQGLADLAADSRDQQEQLALLVSAVENSTPSLAGLRPKGPAVQRSQPAQGVRLLGKRLLRATFGVLRRVWQASAPETREVLVRMGSRPASPGPGLAVVVLTSNGIQGAERAVPEQTDSGFQLWAWDRIAGKLQTRELDRQGIFDHRELISGIAGEYVAIVPGEGRPVSSTFVELVAWVVASEGVHLVEFAAFDEPGSFALSDRLVVASRKLCQRTEDNDLRAALGRHFPGVTGKVVGGATGSDYVLSRLTEPARSGSRQLHRVGRYLVSGRAGIIEHQVAPLAIPAATPEGGGGLLIVLTAPLFNGLDYWLATVLRCLPQAQGAVLVAMAASNSLHLTRLNSLERCCSSVYRFEAFLEPDVWPSAINRLAARSAAGMALVLGPLTAAAASLTTTLPVRHLPLIATQADGDPGIELHLGLTEIITERLRRVHAVPEDRIRQLPPLIDPGWLTEQPAEGAREATRQALGLPDQACLVVMIADLVPTARPEDFVALAYQFAGDQDVYFLLVGQGPLAATVADLVRYFGLVRFLLRDPTSWQSGAEIIAAADVVVSTAEVDLAPVALLTAVAAGTPVVAADSELRAIPEAAGVQALAYVESGNIDQLAAAVRRFSRSRDPHDSTVRQRLVESAASSLAAITAVIQTPPA